MRFGFRPAVFFAAGFFAEVFEAFLAAVFFPGWEDFLGHFERRKLSVGTCARAYGTACIHEHACARWTQPSAAGL
ncbi:hypothetical protein ACH470_41465 [Streptomyces bottropensis]|uniref:hypothetical protein n=1 Tax=Streptomyces bottropensis TaxID=42235 RepID=UPI0037A45582